jgi:hypothetical protein
MEAARTVLRAAELPRGRRTAGILATRVKACTIVITNRGMPTCNPIIETAFDEAYTTIRLDNAVSQNAVRQGREG